jgi:hypothetical protein
MSLNDDNSKGGGSKKQQKFEEIYKRIFSRVENWLKLYPDKSIDATDILHNIMVSRGLEGFKEFADEGEEESLWNSLKNAIHGKFRKSRSKSPKHIPHDKVVHISDLSSELAVRPMAHDYIETRDKRHRQALFLRDSGKFSEKDLVLIELLYFKKIRKYEDLLEEMQKKFPNLTMVCLRKLRERLRGKLKSFPIATEKSTNKNKGDVE